MNQKDILEQVRFISTQFVFFLLNFCFPLIYRSQPWPYWSCLSFFIRYSVCLIFVIFIFLMCAKNLIDSVGVWSVLLINQNVFYSEKTFEIKVYALTLSLKERGKAVQEPDKYYLHAFFFSLPSPSSTVRRRYAQNIYVSVVSASWWGIWIPTDARTGSWISDEPLGRMGVVTLQMVQ